MKPRLPQILAVLGVIGMIFLVTLFLYQGIISRMIVPAPVLAEEGPPTSLVLQPGQAAELASPDGKVLANFSEGSVNNPLTVTLQTLSQPLAAVESWRGAALQSFYLRAIDAQGMPVDHLPQPFWLSLTYSDESLSSAAENQLALFWWDETSQSWQEASQSCDPQQEPQLDTDQNQSLTAVCQFGEFAFFVNSAPPRFSFLPLISKWLEGQTLQGTVTDLQGHPIPGVAVRANGSFLTFTDEEGNYRLSGLSTGPVTIELAKQGYFFPANGSQIDLTENNVLNITALQQAGCYELIDNGSFEKNRAWNILGSSVPASYSTALARSGSRAMRSGILPGWTNRYNWSLFSQEFDIPLNTTSVTLNLWIYQKTTESTTLGESEASGEIETVTYAPSGENQPLSQVDVNYAGLFDTNNNLFTQGYLFATRQNSTNWENKAYLLQGFDGLRVRLRIGTFNDGVGGVTNMFTDDVSLEVCVNPPPVTNLIVNGDFENNKGWARLSADRPALQPQYTTEQKHGGSRSMFAGVKTKGSALKGYSPFEQMITIPAGSTNPVLEFWMWTRSDEANLTATAEEVAPEGSLSLQAEPNNDVQYVAILDTNRKVLQYLVWRRSNTQSWEKFTFNLSSYIGKTFILRFGVYNDGDGKVSSMYIDDVSLTLNTTPVPTATPTLTPTPTNTPAPTNTPTPTLTATPACGPNLFVNSGFETNSGWDLRDSPVKPFYTTAWKYQGTRSMFAGVPVKGSTAGGYSVFQQMVTIPAGAVNSRLEFWMYPISYEANLTATEEQPLDELGLSSLPANDVQYVAILDSNQSLLGYLLWQRSNNRVWEKKSLSLGAYAGQTIIVRFGVANDGDGDVTAMYIDEAYLWACP